MNRGSSFEFEGSRGTLRISEVRLAPAEWGTVVVELYPFTGKIHTVSAAKISDAIAAVIAAEIKQREEG